MDGQTPTQNVSFVLNGRRVSAPADPAERLSDTLREQLGRRDVKVGCNAGDCGACTVLVNGDPVCACLMLSHQIDGQDVETVSGLVATDTKAQQLAQRFQDHGAAQCGICTPGMIVSAVALLRQDPEPDENAANRALGGVLCRCTGYRKIIDAVCGVAANTAKTGKVGDAIRHVDGTAKVIGAERYGDDVAPAGTLEIAIIRSPFARAEFAFSDLEAWQSTVPGLELVLTARDVPGRNCFGVIPDFVDQPVFAETTARFRGEAVAAVVGTPETIRAFDPSSFPLRWTPVDAVSTVTEAQRDSAPLVHRDRAGNLMCRGFVTCGDPQTALRRAAVVTEFSCSTGFVEHAYVEPEAGFAQVIDGRLELHACTQAPVMDLESLEQILAMDRRNIRIVPTGSGGGFGAKLDLSVQPYLALAALRTGQPVRLAYSRTESMQSTTKRHPAEIRIQIGADSNGQICGLNFDGVFNTGAYSSWGPTVANRVPVHASGPYRVADYRAEALGIHTHNPPAGAFRGFGVPQSAIALETALDDLADKLGLDPLDLRLKNVLRDNDPTVCGQVFTTGVGIESCLKALRPAWSQLRRDALEFNTLAKGGLRRGVGVAAGWYGCGNTSLPNPSTILAGVRPDGALVLHQGAADIGQGSNTAITQIFAEALGVSAGDVHLIGPDTDVTPDAGKTSASRQTFVSGNAALNCGQALRADILRHVNASVTATLSFGQGTVRVDDNGQRHEIETSGLSRRANGYVFEATGYYDPPTRALDENGQGVPYAQFGYAAQLAVVEVDEALGTVRAIRFVAAHDVGRAINPLLVEGQVHGGIAQGLGMALMEEYVPGRTENLHDYLIPTIGDVPPIETLIIEVPDAHGPYGAKGLGEHVLIPTAPAILNAIRHASGVRMCKVPVTPSDLRQAIRERCDG